MKTSKSGIELIKTFEGCELKAYQCPAKIWTIGYGNTFYEDGKPVKKGDIITQDRADALLLNLLPKFEEIVNHKVKVPISQNQFDALVSHTWNTGGSETLFKLINGGSDSHSIKYWFTHRYTTGDGKELPGLVRRRAMEASLYFTK